VLTYTASYLWIDAAKMVASGVSAVKASFEISVLSKDLDGFDYTHRVTQHSFTASAVSWGWHQLIPLDQLRQADSPYVSNDRLLLRVDNLTVLNTVAAPPAIAHSGCVLM
jgi:hypothetical protein